MALSEKQQELIDENAEEIRAYIYARCDVCDTDMPWDGGEAVWIVGEPWDLEETVQEAISEVCGLDVDDNEISGVIGQLDLTCPNCRAEWAMGTLVAKNPEPLDLKRYGKTPPNVNVSEIEALVGFADTSGFSRWLQRGGLSDKEKAKVMSRIIAKFAEFNSNTHYFVKMLGDGIMFVQKIPEGSDKHILAENFLQNTQKLVLDIAEVIADGQLPRPKGFRARITCGNIFEITAIDPYDTSKRQTEYIGYLVNLASRLLGVEDDIPIVCTDRVAESIKTGAKIRFTRVNPAIRCLKGIDDEDLKTLKSVEF